MQEDTKKQIRANNMADSTPTSKYHKGSKLHTVIGPAELHCWVLAKVLEHSCDIYLNSLDPSLKWDGWIEEKDLRLEVAIAKHGYCWSKIAEEDPPRTIACSSCKWTSCI